MARGAIPRCNGGPQGRKALPVGVIYLPNVPPVNFNFRIFTISTKARCPIAEPAANNVTLAGRLKRIYSTTLNIT
jgi:hypothetical protein